MPPKYSHIDQKPLWQSGGSEIFHVHYTWNLVDGNWKQPHDDDVDMLLEKQPNGHYLIAGDAPHTPFVQNGSNNFEVQSGLDLSQVPQWALPRITYYTNYLAHKNDNNEIALWSVGWKSSLNNTLTLYILIKNMTSKPILDPSANLQISTNNGQAILEDDVNVAQLGFILPNQCVLASVTNHGATIYDRNLTQNPPQGWKENTQQIVAVPYYDPIVQAR